MLIGILGLGSIGSRHGRNLMTLGHQVIAHDPNILSAPREQVIKEADAVLICSPTKQHVPDFMDVAEAGKHIFMEKPFAFDAPPSYLSGYMRGVYHRYGGNLVVATGFMLRFHPRVMAVKKLIDEGKFGTITEAEFRVLQHNDKPDYMRDGVIRNWASHELDLARHLLGNLEVEYCHTILGSAQERAALIGLHSIEYGGDVSVEADYITKPEVRGFTILGNGQRKAISVDLVMEEKAWDQVYLDEMKAFLAAIDGKDPGPLASAVDGIAVHQLVMDAREKAGLKDDQQTQGNVPVRAV